MSLECSGGGVSQMSGGREFQTEGAATENARSLLGRDGSPPLTFCLWWYSQICATGYSCQLFLYPELMKFTMYHVKWSGLYSFVEFYFVTTWTVLTFCYCHCSCFHVQHCYWQSVLMVMNMFHINIAVVVYKLKCKVRHNVALVCKSLTPW